MEIVMINLMNVYYGMNVEMYILMQKKNVEKHLLQAHNRINLTVVHVLKKYI